MSDKSRVVKFSAEVEANLSAKIDEHNAKVSADSFVSLPMLQVVYRRGAAEFVPSNTFGLSRNEFAMSRVSAFLKLVKTGKPANPSYTFDNDLLPVGHPKALTASADIFSELVVSLKDESEYSSPEEAILALTEYMGFGYESEPAIRAAWLRGVEAGESPYRRAFLMAEYAYESNDADLLPNPEKGVF